MFNGCYKVALVIAANYFVAITSVGDLADHPARCLWRREAVRGVVNGLGRSFDVPDKPEPSEEPEQVVGGVHLPPEEPLPG